MNNTHLLSQEIKWLIIHYAKIGFSNQDIADIVGQACNRPTLSRQTVKTVLLKYQKTKTIENNWNQKGRPHILSEEDFDEIHSFFYENPKKSVNEVINSLGIKASRATVNRTILLKGLRAYRAPTKFYIRPENIQKRYDFSLKMENKGLRYWKSVIFSDESSFQLMNSNGRAFIRRSNDDYDVHQHVQLTSQSATLMVWGAISSKGLGPLVRIDQIDEGVKTLNGPRYLKLLQRYLLRNFPGLKNQNLIFQHDNAPSHRYNEIALWFENKNIRTLEWPAQSPDMNLIENVWNDLKYRLRGEVFKNKDELWRRLKREWKKFDKHTVLELYESMPNRILALNHANGAQTKY